MNISELQQPGAGRHRGRYSDEFKRKIIAACLEPGVSTAAVALANGLNANLLRRWVVESSAGRDSPKPKRTGAAVPMRSPGFIPIQCDPGAAPQADIRIELQHRATTVRVQWPLGASSQCAAWLKEVLQ